MITGAISQVTSKVRIASGVTHLQSRHPAVLASLAMTAQALSDGRFILGVGRSVEAMWKAVGLPPSTSASIVDHADIFRRLCRGDRVRYDGPAGTYPSLRLNDLPDQPVPPLVFAAIGPKGLELAGRHFDGVLLHPFLTPAAVRRSVDLVRGAERASGRPAGSVRVYATVVVACDLPPDEEVAVVAARAVAYYQIPGFGERLAAANGWDTEPLTRLRSHPCSATSEVRRTPCSPARKSSRSRRCYPRHGSARRRRPELPRPVTPPLSATARPAPMNSSCTAVRPTGSEQCLLRPRQIRAWARHMELDPGRVAGVPVTETRMMCRPSPTSWTEVSATGSRSRCPEYRRTA